MKRRGFLGLLIGAAVTPVAKILPAVAPVTMDLADFQEMMKSVYTNEAVSDLVYFSNPFMLRITGVDIVNGTIEVSE